MEAIKFILQGDVNVTNCDCDQADTIWCARIRARLNGIIIFELDGFHLKWIEICIYDQVATYAFMEKNGFGVGTRPSNPNQFLRINRFPPAILGCKGESQVYPAEIGTKCAKCGKVFHKLSTTTSMIHNRTCYKAHK